MFDVSLEDQLVLDDFDIYAQAVGKNIAFERTFNVSVSDVSVSDGSLDLDFLSSVDLAKISAIEIGVVRGDRPYTERSLFPIDDTP